MRILLLWADRYSKPHVYGFLSELKKAGHEVPYWVGILNEDGTEPVIPGTIFHHHYTAWAGFSAKSVDASEFPPPDKELIEKMYKTESMILTMMNKKFDGVCVDERRHIYYNMLGYWRGIIKKHKPDAVIFAAIPHTVYNYIIYDLAKIMGIRTFMFDDLWFANKMLMYTDWMKGSEALRVELARNKDKIFTVNDLSPDFRNYYESHAHSRKDVEPVYMTYYRDNMAGAKNILRRRYKIAFEGLKDGTFFLKAVRFIAKCWKENLRTEYESVQKKPDFSKNFVYVALGFQPEMVNSPLGDMFSDQILMIETLSAALPDGWKIYVKEHPGQWWLRVGTNYSSSRYPGYYRRIAEIKNVSLVPIDTNTFSLIKHSTAISVVTGTPGWEAVLRSKPALVFGYPWYRDCPGVFRVDGVDSCRRVLEKIAAGYKVKQSEVINYLKCLDSVSISGYLETVPARVLNMTKEAAISNIVRVILSELAKNK